jgi:hypothetical protein
MILDTGYWMLEKRSLPAVVAIVYYDGVGPLFFYL